MNKNLQIKPSKTAGSVQMIGGILFTLIGLFVIIPMTSENNGPVWFGVLWTLAAAVGAVIGAINAFSDKGIPTEEIVSDSIEQRSSKSTEARLKELDSLRQQKLISEEEYAETRKHVLDEH
jgi:hypothetical protein